MLALESNITLAYYLGTLETYYSNPLPVVDPALPHTQLNSPCPIFHGPLMDSRFSPSNV